MFASIMFVLNWPTCSDVLSSALFDAIFFNFVYLLDIFATVRVLQGSVYIWCNFQVPVMFSKESTQYKVTLALRFTFRYENFMICYYAISRFVFEIL